MQIRKQDCIMDVDVEKTKAYSQSHSVCDCAEDRNFYTQAKEKFPQLDVFLDELGVDITRPDETGCVELEEEREIVTILVPDTIRDRVMEEVNREFGLRTDAQAIICCVGVEKAMRI